MGPLFHVCSVVPGAPRVGLSPELEIPGLAVHVVTLLNPAMPATSGSLGGIAGSEPRAVDCRAVCRGWPVEPHQTERCTLSVASLVWLVACATARGDEGEPLRLADSGISIRSGADVPV